MGDLEARVAAHYSAGDLLQAIDEGLAALGVAPEDATVATLAPVDEFHTAGRATTLKLLAMSGVQPGMRVLDAGSGIGGAARVLAVESGAEVVGVDLTPVYVDVARTLTERMGLTDRVSFSVGSVTALDFDAESFDAAVSFHVGMNVPDRAAFYGEMARVLRPGGRFSLFDVLKGPGAGMRYPVPWAETGETSFLKTPEEMRGYLIEAGFRIVAEEDLTEFAIGFFRDVFAKAAKSAGPPPLGLHLLTGANAGEKFQNYAAALDDDQIAPMIMVAEKV